MDVVEKRTRVKISSEALSLTRNAGYFAKFADVRQQRTSDEGATALPLPERSRGCPQRKAKTAPGIALYLKRNLAQPHHKRTNTNSHPSSEKSYSTSAAGRSNAAQPSSISPTRSRDFSLHHATTAMSVCVSLSLSLSLSQPHRGWGTWYNGLGHNGKGYNGISYNLGNRKGV